MTSKEQEIVKARINDAIKQCETKSIPKYIGFLDLSSATAAVFAAQKAGLKSMLYGGYKEADRVCFGVFPEWCEPSPEDFPVTRLKIAVKADVKLGHRDILGAFMSAGIERDTVGDIVMSGEYPVAFVRSSVAKHLMAHIDKIASVGVELKEDGSDEFTVKYDMSEMSGTVASMRLDCVVAELASLSRSKAAELIVGKAVSVNGIETVKCTAEVSAADVISVRHIGKFVVDECDRVTKKGRIALCYRKYN